MTAESNGTTNDNGKNVCLPVTDAVPNSRTESCIGTPNLKKVKQQTGPKKSRFDGLDVAAMVAHIRRTLLGHKLVNIYDGSALSTTSDSVGKTVYIFKLANPTVSDGKAAMLLVESGVRFHATSFYSASSSTQQPSPFCMKLRKHIRGARLDCIVQLGNLDRVVDFRFGSGNAHHVLVEFYGQGNIILTNGDYVILALLRLHEYSANAEDPGGQVKLRVGNVYPVTYATTLSIPRPTASTQEDPTSTTVQEVIDSDKKTLLHMNGEEAYLWAKSQMQVLHEKSHDPASTVPISEISKKQVGKKKNDAKDGSIRLKMLLLKPSSGVFHYGPSLVDHCIRSCPAHLNLEPNLKFSLTDMEKKVPPAAWEALVFALREEGTRVLENLNTREPKGYILYHEKEPVTFSNNIDSVEELNTSQHLNTVPHADKVFEEFQPHLLQQHINDRLYVEYPTFATAVDEYFSLLEGQKRALRAEAAERAAHDRLSKIKFDQERRLQALELDMEKVRLHAQLVELHADDVDKALGVVNSALETGMDWDTLGKLVDVEKVNNNPIALIIERLDLEKDVIVLSLADTMSWDATSDYDSSPVIVDIPISLKESAHGNARAMYDKYHASKEKSQKTVEASSKAFKAAQANAERQLADAQKKKVTVLPQRKLHWFEKFHWFVTSDNYLVLGGKDAQQNELLVKKYMRSGDAYLHADVFGASSCILRAKRRRKSTTNTTTEAVPLSDQALREAGNFTICRSAAWASRMVTSAWWVESHQVSKTAPTGEYLTVGSFMVRGKKNFLPHSHLEMGLAVMFRLGDDASIARHRGDRRDFTLLESVNTSFSGDDDDDVDVSHVCQYKSNDNGKDVADDGHDEEQTGNADDKNVLKTPRFANGSNAASKPGSPPLSFAGDTAELSATETKESKCTVELSAPLTDENTELESRIRADNNDGAQVVGTKIYDEDFTPVLRKKKGLSTHDRKLLKRFGSLTAAEQDQATKSTNEEAKSTRLEIVKHVVADGKETQNNSLVALGQGLSRGKRLKMKKMAKKYADQDEEDRELALQALHGGEKKRSQESKGLTAPGQTSSNQRKAAAATTALLVRDAWGVAEKLPEAVRDILTAAVTVKAVDDDNTEAVTTVRWDNFDADILEQLLDLEGGEGEQLAVANRLLDLSRSSRVNNYSASLAGIIRTVKKYGHDGLTHVTDENSTAGKKQQKNKAEKEAWREILAEDGIIDDDDDDGGENEFVLDDTAEIAKLTGKPLPEDVLLYAVPVCAPYQTLVQYKYRVKLTPGSQKRGKASKQCVEMFLQRQQQYSTDDDATNRNRELIKLVNENEWVQTICGDVKISAAGASKIAKKQKAGNKTKKM